MSSKLPPMPDYAIQRAATLKWPDIPEYYVDLAMWQGQRCVYTQCELPCEDCRYFQDLY